MCLTFEMPVAQFADKLLPVIHGNSLPLSSLLKLHCVDSSKMAPLSSKGDGQLLESFFCLTV